MGGTSQVYDFTLEKYSELCDTLLNCGYSILPVHDFLIQCQKGLEPIPRCAIMRHDIDRKPMNALRMAGLEHARGIRSTYYFRYPHTFLPYIINQIQDLGHEIGYHYEVLVKVKGDHKKAIILFKQELQVMRERYEITTICMHGSPLSRFDNRDLWKYYNFKDFGIVGEAYLSMNTMHYYSDTGRNWNARYSVRDQMMPGSQGKGPVTTDELLETIQTKQENPLYISTHPERWADTFVEWYSGYFRDFIFNMGKRIIIGLRI